MTAIKEIIKETNEVLEFIQRRFTTDCKWTTGNCYYFSLILKDRFPDGTVYYDVIQGHFVFLYQGQYYDWTGVIQPKVRYLVEWDKFEEYDLLQYQHIIRDCLQ